MKVTNSKGYTYEFTTDEMLTVFMFAYGYVDIAERYTQIQLPMDYESSIVTQKLTQCFADEFNLTELTNAKTS